MFLTRAVTTTEWSPPSSLPGRLSFSLSLNRPTGLFSHSHTHTHRHIYKGSSPAWSVMMSHFREGDLWPPPVFIDHSLEESYSWCQDPVCQTVSPVCLPRLSLPSLSHISHSVYFNNKEEKYLPLPSPNVKCNPFCGENNVNWSRFRWSWPSSRVDPRQGLSGGLHTPHSLFLFLLLSVCDWRRGEFEWRQDSPQPPIPNPPLWVRLLI